MSRAIGGQSSTPKEVIPDESYDPRIKIFGDVKGKAEQVKLMDIDMMDQVLFPQMNIVVFWDMVPRYNGRHAVCLKDRVHQPVQLHNHAPQGSTGLWDHWRGCVVQKVSDKSSAQHNIMARPKISNSCR
jgi:hypothetical protein